MNIFSLFCDHAYGRAYGHDCAHAYGHVRFHVCDEHVNLNDFSLLKLIYRLSHDYSFNCVCEFNFYDYNLHCVYARLIDLMNFI